MIVYLEADTNVKASRQPPVLTVSVGDKVGLQVPIEGSEVFLKKIRVKADATSATDEWVDLRLSMNQSFVPKTSAALNQDDRELGLLVYHLYVADAAQAGSVEGVTDAVELAPAPAKAAAKAAAAKR